MLSLRNFQKQFTWLGWFNC